MSLEAFLVLRVDVVAPVLQLRRHLLDHLHTELGQMSKRTASRFRHLLQLIQTLNVQLDKQWSRMQTTNRPSNKLE